MVIPAKAGIRCFKGFLYSHLLGSDNMTDFYEAIHGGFRIFLKALRKEK